ncbi:MAG: hypothetical protein ACM3ZC_15705 [Bacteroidota bacterium]
MSERWPRNRDVIRLGALAGICGSFVRNALEVLAVLLIPSYKSCARLAASLFLRPDYVMKRLDAYVVGLEIDFILGMAVGIAAVLVLSVWGLEGLLYKGALGGAFTWFLFYAFLSADPLSALDPTGTFLEAQVSLAIHILFGIAVVWSASLIDGRKENAAKNRRP